MTLQLFPFAGLSSINDMPTMGALDPNPALIDGNLTAAAGINIGLPPLGGDTRRRNMGLDFLNVTEVNELFIWVDRELPADVADSFSWDIYTSSDNLNWTLQFTLSPPTAVVFGPFQNRFDITFPANLKTRFIKTVIKPLAISPSVPDASKFPNIFVTEIQAFVKQSAAQVVGTGGQKTLTTTSHIYNLDTRTRILNIPSLFYNLTYFFTRTDPSAQQRWILSNGFTGSYQFNRVFSGSGQVAREDGSEEQGRRVAYVYNASITAVPLRTLRDTFLYSGRTETIGGKSSDTNSFFLNNTAALYKGIDINLNGGINFSTDQTGVKSTNTISNFGATIVPHPALTLNLNFSDTATSQSGGGKPPSSTFSRRGDLSLTYGPFDTVRIFISEGILMAKGQKKQIMQNYGINWSPFPDGTLQFNFAYNESLSSVDNSINRIVSPSLRWKITSRVFLDVSYANIHSSSKSGRSDSDSFDADLKIIF